MVADLVDLHDVDVLQPGDGLGLGQEAGQLVVVGVGPGEHHLQCNVSSGSSSENLGFEYNFLAAIVNGGSNKEDGSAFGSTAIGTYE